MPATFVAPLGPLIPVIAIVVGGDRRGSHARAVCPGGLAALAAGAAFFIAMSITARRTKVLRHN